MILFCQEEIVMKQQNRLKRKKFRRFRFFCILFIFILTLFLIHHELGDKNPTTNVDTANTSAESEEKQDITIHLSAIGDAMCHSQNFKDAYHSDTNTYDFSHVFTEVKDHLSQADIAIGNLETTFAGEERGYSGYPTFNTPAALGNSLKDIGIDVLSTANNHSLDKGYSGIVSTLDKLDEIGISHMGTYRSVEE